MSRVSCRICNTILTSDNAYTNRTKGGFQTACKVCGKDLAKSWRTLNREREKERANKYYAKHKDRLRPIYDRSRVIRKYGLTPEDIKAMIAAQGGLCLICVKRPATDVDHSHVNGVIRGILCKRCNTTLGLLDDDPQCFRRAADYLDKFDDSSVHPPRPVLPIDMHLNPNQRDAA